MLTPTDMEYFIALAQGGTSSGERAATELALAVVRHAPSLDYQARAGLVEFLSFAVVEPETAAALVREKSHA